MVFWETTILPREQNKNQVKLSDLPSLPKQQEVKHCFLHPQTWRIWEWAMRKVVALAGEVLGRAITQTRYFGEIPSAPTRKSNKN